MRLATRDSDLALTQARHVAGLLGGAELLEVRSSSDRRDKSRFVRAVEEAVLAGEADIGVHSAKDLPGTSSEGLEIAAVTLREDPADAWVGAARRLEEVPQGARVGTASLRRQAQLLSVRPDIRVEELHGNVDTRLRKLAERELDGIVLAAAGLRRLGRSKTIAFRLPAAVMTPAAGQGILALQVRTDATATRALLAEVGDETAMRELTAERAVVAALDASCSSPLGVWARAAESAIAIDAFVGLPDGSEPIRESLQASGVTPERAGALLARRLLDAGAAEILERADAAAAR